MNAQTNFSDILDRTGPEVEKPKPLPVGTYLTVLQGIPRQDKSAKKQTPFVEFSHKIVSAGEDVDPDDLATALALPDGTAKNLQEVIMRNTFYLTEGSAWRLKDFLVDIGFADELEAGEMSMREMIENSTGRSVNIFIKHESSQDGTSIFAQIAGTSAAE